MEKKLGSQVFPQELGGKKWHIDIEKKIISRFARKKSSKGWNIVEKIELEKKYGSPKINCGAFKAEL